MLNRLSLHRFEISIAERAPRRAPLPRPICAAVFVLLVIGSETGCATFTRGAIIRSEDVVVETRSEQRFADSHDFDVMQTGTSARIVGTRFCDDVATERIRTTTYFAAENTTPNRTRLSAIAAAAMIAGGVVLAVLPNVEPEPGEEASALDARTSRLLGGGMIGAGFVVSIFPLRDVGRARRPVAVTEERDAATLTTASNVRCAQPAAASYVGVALMHPDGSTVELGVTDADGILTLALDRLVPAEWLTGPASPTSLAIIVDHATVGHVDSAPVRAIQDDAAFASLDLDACVADENSHTCVQAEGYLTMYPNGRHRVDVEPVVASAQRRIEERRRQAAAELERELQEAEARIVAELESQRHRAEAERAATEAEERRRHQRAAPARDPLAASRWLDSFRAGPFRRQMTTNDARAACASVRGEWELSSLGWSCRFVSREILSISGEVSVRGWSEATGQVMRVAWRTIADEASLASLFATVVGSLSPTLGPPQDRASLGRSLHPGVFWRVGSLVVDVARQTVPSRLTAPYPFHLVVTIGP